MMQRLSKIKGSRPLLVWILTGRRKITVFRTIWRIISSVAFLIGVAIVAIVAMVVFGLADWRFGAIASTAASLATISILLRSRARGKLSISKRQAKRCNAFHYVMPWFENRYVDHIDLESERTQEDDAMSILLYRQFGESLIALKLFEDADCTKISILSGKEFELVKPLEFHVDFILRDGVGYVMLKPSVSLIAEIGSVDEAKIKHTLREIGLIGWDVESVDYNEGVKLFVLRDDYKRYSEITYNDPNNND